MRYALALALLAGSALVSAQSTPAGGPVFEVASVKPNVSGASVSTSRSVKGSFTATNVPLRSLIAQAYGVRANRVAGPGWIDTAFFDVNARAPENAPDSQINQMLRALLVDRFKVVARTETRDQPVYALVVADKAGRLGPGLVAAAECDKAGRAGGIVAPGVIIPQVEAAAVVPCGMRSISNPKETVINGGAVSMADLARNLDGRADRLVIDRTGLTGTYNVALRFSQPSVQSTGQTSDLPVIFTALQEQLGLKLESTRGPVEFLVIDRIEQPTPD